MSFLAPLYMLGLAALSLPVVLHLIRRIPRGRYAFSSLMFLKASPPRLTRRSRLDHIFLLLLRLLALALLACAFARPFLREAADLSLAHLRGRQVAILLDTSASMRRGDLWSQATERVEDTLADLEPADDVALYVFDSDMRNVVAFDDKPSLDRRQKPDLVRRQLAGLRPTWAHSDLGTALVTLAETMQIVHDRSESQTAQQIVLISDLQRGASVDTLQATDWPEELFVSVEMVAPTLPSNASLRRLADDATTDSRPEPRVRVVNASDSTSEQYYVAWASSDQPPSWDDAIAIYVPPGQSRVVHVPRPDELPEADRLVLKGDASEFDNTYFDVPPRRQEWNVVYVGGDGADDPKGLLYYLQRALGDTPHRSVNIVAQRSDEPFELLDPESTSLVVISEAIAPPKIKTIEGFLEAGGSLFLVPTTREAAVSLVGFTGKAELANADDERVDDYVMLADIDFSHPVFASMASPRYSDFTKIHFWSHFPFKVQDDSSVRILARFDNGDPALWEQSLGQGHIFVLASGWRPRDSQLALSSKFVPLLASVLDQASGGPIELSRYTVGETVHLPLARDLSSPVSILEPDGTRVSVSSGTQQYDDVRQPGIYEVSLAGEPHRFAVNLATQESDTALLEVERLEQLGVRLGNQATPSEESANQRQLRDVELEGRQKLWRWLIAVALGVLIVETWWAGRATRKRHLQAADTAAERFSSSS